MQIDQLIRSKRKTVALIVENDGRLVVRAPQHLSLQQIRGMVDLKAGWIKKKRDQLQVMRATNPLFAPKHYEPGEQFVFLGKFYPLKIVSNSRPLLQFSEEYFLLAQKALPRAKQVFVDWYREQARKICTQRAAEFVPCIGVYYDRIRISSARTRWGSCSSRGTLSFTWRLVLTPLEIIDYVIVHELAHLHQPNHSSKFWAIVEQTLPDFKRRRAWLKKNGRQIQFF